MENVTSAFRKFSNDAKIVGYSHLDSPSPSPPVPEVFPAGALATRPPRQLVSLWTCSKLCAVCFVAGVFVGYTLKRRVRRWLSNVLRRLKDD